MLIITISSPNFEIFLQVPPPSDMAKLFPSRGAADDAGSLNALESLRPWKSNSHPGEAAEEDPKPN